MDVNVIIYECMNGNKTSFDELILMYQQPFYKFCYFLCKNKYDADDLFQLTWLKVYEKIKLYNPSLSFKNWLYTIANNLFKDLKKKKQMVSLSDDLIEQLPSQKEDHLISKLVLEQEILKLEEELRIPLLLFYFEGFKLSEISQILDIKLSTIKYRIKVAKETLYQILKDDEDE